MGFVIASINWYFIVWDVFETGISFARKILQLKMIELTSFPTESVISWMYSIWLSDTSLKHLELFQSDNKIVSNISKTIQHIN